MAGETSLSTLLASMSPTLHPATYTFLTVPADTDPSSLSKLLGTADMILREDEGWTVILSRKDAVRLGHTDGIFPSRKITLNVHSSLEAVGFLAVITTRLAKELNIGVNPVSGYFHDESGQHLYIPEGTEKQVMEHLRLLSEEHRKGE